jgi:hypothetical protein
MGAIENYRKNRLRKIRAQDAQEVQEEAQRENQYYDRMTQVLAGFPKQNINQRVNRQNSLETEKANELKRLQQESATDQRMYSQQKQTPKKIQKLLAQSYQRVKRHDRPLWIINITVAICLDVFVDMITMIPIVGWIIGGLAGIVGGLYLTISLWKVGNRKARTKKRILRVAMLILDMFPYIGVLPISTATVLIAFNDSKKSSDKAKATIKKIKKKYPNVRVN